jgi:predicted protein tyrosine phosphatase
MLETVKLLFVCTGNRDRSPTAELLHQRRPGLEAKSAGTAPGAPSLMSAALADWADVIVVMEKAHEVFVRECYLDKNYEKTIFCLNIPDKYRFMNEVLVQEINERMKQVLSWIDTNLRL